MGSDLERRWSSWDEHLQWLADVYSDGWTIQDISDDTGMSTRQISERLNEAGVETRDPHASGPDNPLWSGGQPWRAGHRWRTTRQEALSRDDRECQQCGRRRSLHVHHIKPVSEGGEKYKLSNLITLCSECHTAAHAE